MKATKFLAIDYPHLDPATAVWEEARRLRQEAYHWRDGRIVGIRNINLLARSLELAASVPDLLDREQRAAARRENSATVKTPASEPPPKRKQPARRS